MLGTAAAILLLFLPLQVNALITTDAKCLPGYTWMFSSMGQSPCDVAAELASVCIARPFGVDPLPVDYVYASPTLENQNNCRCSSVFYSLLSGCAYCQDRNYRRWSVYTTNCSRVYLTVFPEEIPVGVKVPAYAYQNVSVSDGFNATLAYSTRGIESSRPLPSSTQIPTPTSTSASLAAASSSSGGDGSTTTNTPAIVGGAVGGVVGLGLIAALITFLVLRSKQKSRSQNHNSDFPQSPNMVHTPNTTASLMHSAASPPPGSPGMVYNPNDPSTYSFADPNMYDPHRQHSPPPISQNMTPNFPSLNVTPNFTGNSAQNSVPPQTMPQNTGPRSQYSGMPEL